MIAALRAAGFAGVEPGADGAVHARLPASLAEFTATPSGSGWALSLCWPVRASQAQIAAWNEGHPRAVMDIWQGETRIVMQVRPGPDLGPDLALWADLAAAMVTGCIRWRRAQRAPGEGM